ncbi:MAG: imidazole glycerol phosphate synthase subunit HisH [Hydrotalea sp.]|nr:imidazole glycerol phosphate synthase subunit HisH [Hydrotalea sp.]
MNQQHVAIIDYGYGNIFSVKRAVEHVGGRVSIIADGEDLAKQLPNLDRIILPGQGAFPACRRALEPFLKNLLPAITEQQKPLLGICVGMQLLADKGFEFEEVAGLGLMPGAIKNFKDIWQGEEILEKKLTLPQMEWNQVKDKKNHPLMAGIDNGDYFYFVHGFAFADYDQADVIAAAHYGVDYPMVMARGNIAGIQCHPEKSQKAGLQFLKNFMAWNGEAS